MKETIKNLIEIAEKIEDIDIQYQVLEQIKNIIYELATTINCPSNWRSIGEEIAKEIDGIEYNYIYETLQLWEYAE